MATDRQTSCLYCLGQGICFKAGKQSLIADCENCDDYKPKVSKQHKDRLKLKIVRRGFAKL